MAFQAAQLIVSTSKGISQWNKDRKRERSHSGDREGHHDRRMSVGSVAASEGSHGEKKRPELEREATSHTVTTTAKNYFKNVSENKEVAKLVSLLSTSINSTKKV
jgi:dynein heavy chain